MASPVAHPAVWAHVFLPPFFPLPLSFRFAPLSLDFFAPLNLFSIFSFFSPLFPLFELCFPPSLAAVAQGWNPNFTVAGIDSRRNPITMAIAWLPAASRRSRPTPLVDSNRKLSSFRDGLLGFRLLSVFLDFTEAGCQRRRSRSLSLSMAFARFSEDNVEELHLTCASRILQSLGCRAEPTSDQFCLLAVCFGRDVGMGVTPGKYFAEERYPDGVTGDEWDDGCFCVAAW